MPGLSSLTSLMLGRAFFNGLPITLSSGKLLPKSPAVDIPASAEGFPLSGGVAASPASEVAPGDFLELVALSGSAECCLLS
jgi:hypothetical protein